MVKWQDSRTEYKSRMIQWHPENAADENAADFGSFPKFSDLWSGLLGGPNLLIYPNHTVVNHDQQRLWENGKILLICNRAIRRQIRDLRDCLWTPSSDSASLPL